MRYLTLLLALAFTASAQTYIFGGGKAAAIVGPQATTLPASCATEGLLLRLTADDGANKRGLYYCVNGTYTRSGFTGTEGRLLRFGAANAVGVTTGLFEDGSGNVGIGTAGPGNNLHIYGDSATGATIENATFGSYNANLTLKNNTGATGILSINSNGVGGSWTNGPTPGGATTLFTSGGALVLGGGATGVSTYVVSSDTTKLAVAPGNTGTGINIYSGAAGQIPLVVNGFSGQTADLFQVASISGAVYVNVTNQGNVGIGTTTPTTKLDIWGTIAGGWAAQTEGGCNTYADLAVDATLNTKVTSASYNFVAADVGSWLDITAGGAWTGGRYVITAVAANAATLASSPAAVSSTGGTFITGRGKIVHVAGATDVADTLRFCGKGADNAMAWRALY